MYTFIKIVNLLVCTVTTTYTTLLRVLQAVTCKMYFCRLDWPHCQSATHNLNREYSLGEVRFY